MTEVVLVHWNIVNNDYQQDSRVLYIFIPNKSFGQLFGISPKIFIFLKSFIQSYHILKYGFLIMIFWCDCSCYQIFKAIFSISSRNIRQTDNPPIRMYVNKIWNRITFRIKTGYYLESLIPGTKKLLWSTKSQITKDKNGEMGLI